MATAYEVEEWKDRCRRLTASLDKSRREKEELTRRIRDNSEEAESARAIADGLEWEVDDLKSDNAKLTEKLRTRESENKDLRKQIGDADRINGRLVGENESLKAENEKLRQLVRDMWCDGMCDCDEQYTCAQCEYHYPDRMRELGIEIEVDDD